MVINGINFPEQAIEAFCRRHGVKRLSLFGSILREPSPEGGYGFRPTSDIDMLVEFEPAETKSLLDLGGMLMELQHMLGRQVNLGPRRTCLDTSDTRCCVKRGRSMPRDPLSRPLDDRIRAQHMLEAARHATSYVTGRSRRDLDTDSMLARALLHAVQEIGEAAAKTSPAGRDRLPGVPWTKIVGMRNRLVHGYWDIDLDLVWIVATRDLPPLIASLDAALAAWPLPEPPGEGA